MVNNDIYLGPGNVSMANELGAYYQDFKPAIYHFENDSLGRFDEEGIPFLIIDGRPSYSVVYIIQYALILHDIYLSKNKNEEDLERIQKCLNWLDERAEKFKDSLVWRSEENKQYGLKKGWISAMYQGQAISLYLRAYQLFDKSEYLEKAQLSYNYFKYDYAEGGARRTDDNGYVWLEEYPTKPPSYVLNGFVYTVFGILDLYRVTGNTEVKELYDTCISTLKANIHKYHLWYWSVYDQDKKQLSSYYYQKNIHIPLMEILYKLTGEEIFNTYRRKWTKQLKSKLSKWIVKVMYRVQPRVKKIL